MKYTLTETPEQKNQNALMEAESARAMQEVNAAIMLAKRFPRDEVAALNQILTSCKRPMLAEKAIYSYARGGQDISGASIRLLESVAQVWGNIQAGIKELSSSNGESVMQAFAWDLQTNTRIEKTFVVPHTRYSKDKGNTPLTDPRDIYERTANDGARRLRACLEAVIPGDIIEEAKNECLETMKRSVKLDEKSMDKMAESFEAIGVSKSQIEKFIQRNIYSATASHVVRLRTIFSSIKDGIGKPEDYFEAEATAPKPKAEAEIVDPFKSLDQPRSNEAAAPKENQESLM